MYDRQQRRIGGSLLDSNGAASRDATMSTPGRATLVEQLRYDEPPQRSSMFPQGAEWELIDHESMQMAREGGAAPDTSTEDLHTGVRGSEVDPGGASDSLSQSSPPVQGDFVVPASQSDYTDRHGGKNEHAPQNSEASRFPHHSPLNRAIVANSQRTIKVGRHKQLDPLQINRAGVRVHDRKHDKAGRDVFRLRHDKATRYRVVVKDGKNTGEPVDELTQADVQRDRLALNRSHTKDLWLGLHPTKSTTCVLSWFGNRGSAWIPVSALVGKTTDIIKATNDQARESRPNISNVDRTKLQEFVFRDVIDPQSTGNGSDLVGSSDPGRDDQLYVLPNVHRADRGNHADDYLGHATNGILGGRRKSYNINMNLPQKGAAPVAIDVVAPGDRFFVSTTQDIPLFKLGESTAQVMQTWAFGFIGKAVPQPEGSPPKYEHDENRFGWVPVRTIKPAEPPPTKTDASGASSAS